MSTSTINAEDLIFYSDKENNIYSGGFKLNSVMLKQGLSPIVTLNQNHDSNPQRGGSTSSLNTNNVSDLFNHLVVPNWAFTTPFKKVGGKKMRPNEEEEKEGKEEDDFVSDDLHNKLLSMVKVEDSKQEKAKANKKTRNSRMKNTNTNKNKTKKNK